MSSFWVQTEFHSSPKKKNAELSEGESDGSSVEPTLKRLKNPKAKATKPHATPTKSNAGKGTRKKPARASGSKSAVATPPKKVTPVKAQKAAASQSKVTKSKKVDASNAYFVKMARWEASGQSAKQRILLPKWHVARLTQAIVS